MNRAYSQAKWILDHKILRNTAWLTVLQLFGYIAPLIALPHLTRVLSKSDFGAVMVTLSVLQICLVITDYGFSLSATQRIAANRTDKDLVNKIAGAVLATKLGLVTITICLIFAGSFSAYPSIDKSLIIASFGAILGQAYQSNWLYQGLERLKPFVAYTAATKILYVGLVYTLITPSSDPSLVIYWWSLANLLGALGSFALMRRCGIKPSRPQLKTIFEELKSGLPFFASRVAVSSYTSSNTVVLSHTGLVQAALYGCAEQLYRGAQSLTAPLSQALFPNLSANREWKTFLRFVPAFFVAVTLGSTAVYLLAELLIIQIFGIDYLPASDILKTLSIVVSINFLGTTLGYPAWTIVGKIQVANSTVIFGALIHLSILTFLIFSNSANGANVALSVLATEVCVLSMRAILLLKHYIETDKKK